MRTHYGSGPEPTQIAGCDYLIDESYFKQAKAYLENIGKRSVEEEVLEGDADSMVELVE